MGSARLQIVAATTGRPGADTALNGVHHSEKQQLDSMGHYMKTSLRKLTLAWPLAIFLLLPALTRAVSVNQAWVQRYNGPGNGDDEATAVAVDGSNNVIVTGFSIGSGSGYDYATIRYSGAGVPLWTNRYNGPGNGNDYAQSMAVDGSNNVIVHERRQRLRLCDDQVFERRRAALDQPLQWAGQRR